MSYLYYQQNYAEIRCPQRHSWESISLLNSEQNVLCYEHSMAQILMQFQSTEQNAFLRKRQETFGCLPFFPCSHDICGLDKVLKNYFEWALSL